MILHHTTLYLFTFIAAFVMSLILTPAARAAAVIFKIFESNILSSGIEV